MNIMQQVCSSCAGLGYIDQWLEVKNGVSFSYYERKTVECTACHGKGHNEYAVFDIEEAKAILKHCGLSTES